MTNRDIIQTGHSLAEKIDNDTNKILCLECGGKGFYLLVQAENRRGEFVHCEYCEKGFKYIKRGLKEHGKS